MTMSSDYVHPTHSCFDDSLDLMIEILRSDPTSAPFLRLAHGIILRTGDDRPMAHAWLEDLEGDRAFFVGIIQGERYNLAAPCQDFYLEMRVQERTLYSYREVLALNRLHGNYGPWIERYRELCRDHPKWLAERNEVGN